MTFKGSHRSDSQGRASWYPGSWSGLSRSKAAPVTEVARESISVAQNIASSATDSPTPSIDTSKRTRAPSIQLIKKAGSSTRSLPVDATITRVNVASSGSASTTALENLEAPEAAEPEPESSKKEVPANGNITSEENPEKEQSANEEVDSNTNTNSGSAALPEQSGGWLSWIYRSDNTDKTNSSTQVPEAAKQTTDDLQEPTAAYSQTATSDTPGQTEQPGQVPAHPVETAEDTSPNKKRSWLQMFYGSAAATREDKGTPETNTMPAESDNTTTGPMAPKDTPDKQGDELPSQTPPANTKSSGWSFWSKATTKDAAAGKPQEAEAVAASIPEDTPSRPTTLEPDSNTQVNITQKGSLKVPQPKETGAKDVTMSTVEATSTASTSAEGRPVDASASKQLQKILPNQVLPHFEDTYRFEESPSLLQSLGRLLHYTKGVEHSHVTRVRDPPKIKRALAIGVHGYFPAPFIRTVLGQPTGTSIRFSNMAAEAIRKWTAGQGYSCEIEKIALEGEGRITERVDLLWKLLLNWMEEIRKADFILIASHSQGVPVSIMLVAKLIAFGCVNASRVGICAMAGVNMGPFSSYRSRWISGSAGELFEFELPSSKVSRDYEAALRCALDFGVRITYVGSIDDQLVSLESSLFSPIAHPYIYRAVFVDGRVHAPSFLSHLVGFTLKLRNLGVQDHGLIRELSLPLAGSLYGGEGHSRLYDDEAVYFMAIQFALETSVVPGATLRSNRTAPSPTTNPYILPFAMRGILEEERVRQELHEETMELLRQFDDWRPSTKILKDVKFRLEGIRSKL
ncbi:hypothetical protein N7468_001187 [Penicillium chermesinum]|uniref:YMC020W-like alpha/beta hydrolase domain-containing protein n=1 Tax=Penicillium chermesinum TaxID=63820 RepID=A0A9W9TYD9_9EURO|nr:uncharacterized protein N7468_001187 [Penicillium chermesinum]KAJ5246204.1 hypothetical protein N7468_001187 [Penicillium chermesinum]